MYLLTVIKRIPRWLIIMISIFVILYISIKSYVYFSNLSHVPDKMGVWKIDYIKEEFFGYGPGGAENVVIVYSLPENTAKDIQKTGIEYFSNLPKRTKRGRNWRGVYEKWHTTPLKADWVPKHESLSLKKTTAIASYLNRYGITMDLDSDVEREINESILASGSFYAYGRIGIIIVAPRINKVFYVISG